MPLQGRRSRIRARVATILAVAVVATTSLAIAPSAAAITPVQDPERNSSSVTGWGWHTNVSPATISAYVAQGNRIIDLEVNSSSPTFSVAYVKNSGTYQRAWWWYYGLTQTQVNSYLTTNNARLIDVEPYSTASGIRYAVVMVANTGAAAKTWWWRTGYSVSQIGSFATTNGARPIDIDRYTVGSATYFAAIFVKNTAPDNRGWWHYYGVTTTQIATYLGSTGGRLIDIERDPSTGRYDIIIQSGSSPNWWWYHGQSSTALANLASQNGARIYKIEPYLIGTTRFYAALLINDVDAETTRIRNLVSSKMSGSWGFYLKKVRGSDVLGLQPDRIFEPASMIKAVHHAHAMKQAYNGVAGSSLTSDVTWRALGTDDARYPSDFDYSDDKDKCAYLSDGSVDPAAAVYVDDLGTVILKQMMEQSDNRTTDAVVNKYGMTAINATADALGMTRTQLYHRIGCDSDSPPSGWRHNELTLRDAGRLYEQVDNGTWLGTGTYRTKFFEFMVDGAINSTGDLATMIKTEAAAAGLTTTEVNTFLANTKTASKGGSYGQCPDGGGTCDPPTVQSRTVGGVIWIPFKNTGGTIVPTSYVYGRFFNTQFSCSFAAVKAGSCTSFNNVSAGMTTVSAEMFRAVIKQAVASW